MSEVGETPLDTMSRQLGHVLDVVRHGWVWCDWIMPCNVSTSQRVCVLQILLIQSLWGKSIFECALLTENAMYGDQIWMMRSANQNISVSSLECDCSFMKPWV